MKRYINSLQDLEEKFDFELLLKEIHENKLTCRDMEHIYGIEQRFMSDLNKKLNLGIKHSWAQQKSKYNKIGLTKEILYELYIINEYSLNEIGHQFNVTTKCIKSALLFFNVCSENEIRPFNYDGYYDNRRVSSLFENDTRIYRSIMSEYIGRDLDENEVVHHIDFDRSHNDISNLFLFNDERTHLLYHGYINNINHEYIDPQTFINDIYPNYQNTFMDYDWLYYQYITMNNSIVQISKLCDVSRGVIKRSLESFSIIDLKEKRINQYK